MRKILLLFLVGIVLASCQKNEESSNVDIQDVVFSGINVSGSEKASDADPCADATADYAEVVIDGVTYRPAVFYIDGLVYTQALKFNLGTYTISKFMLLNDSGTPENLTDDVIISATPLEGAEFAEFVSDPLTLDFTVEAFKKAEIPVEVLCFDEKEYQSFGFTWFALEGITVREQVFFGDFCAKHPEEYIGSLYENQENGVQLDMPAIFKVEVYRKSELISSYDNEEWYGEGAPLKIQYPDHDDELDEFTFELFILIKNGTAFEYKHFHTWKFIDDEMIETGGDGVVDFVLGNCNASEADLALAPYINLPKTLTYKIKKVPGELGGFFDTEIIGVGDGYDIWNGMWPTFCGDYSTSISPGTTYTMDVYSSLYPELFPAFVKEIVNEDNLDRINWLMNNLDNYPNRSWKDVQAFIWKEISDWNGGSQAYVGTYASRPLAAQMREDAANYGEGYVPFPGGWGAVILTAGETVQLQIVVVDP